MWASIVTASMWPAGGVPPRTGSELGPDPEGAAGQLGHAGDQPLPLGKGPVRRPDQHPVQAQEEEVGGQGGSATSSSPAAWPVSISSASTVRARAKVSS